MLTRKKVQINCVFKRLIFDSIKLNENLKNEYTLLDLQNKKIREEAIFYLKEEGYLEKNILTIPPFYFNIYSIIENTRNSLLKDDFYNKKEKFIKIFKECLDEFNQNKILDKYIINLNTLKNLATDIHYVELPEYSVETILNREYIPEEFTSNFYDHFNTLEILYNFLISPNNALPRTTLGDITLNKNLTLKIYSNINKSYKTYNIERTIYGWNCHFFKTKYGNISGEAIITTLNQDLISFPITLPTFFKELWEKSNSSNMTLEELQENINNIAQWISLVEQNKPNLF